MIEYPDAQEYIKWGPDGDMFLVKDTVGKVLKKSIFLVIDLFGFLPSQLV